MCCMTGPEATAPYFAGEASAPSAAKASDRERREQQAIAGSREGSPSSRAQGACGFPDHPRSKGPRRLRNPRPRKRGLELRCGYVASCTLRNTRVSQAHTNGNYPKSCEREPPEQLTHASCIAARAAVEAMHSASRHDDAERDWSVGVGAYSREGAVSGYRLGFSVF